MRYKRPPCEHGITINSSSLHRSTRTHSEASKSLFHQLIVYSGMVIHSEAFSAASPGQRPVRAREQPDFALSPRSRTQLQGNYLYAAISAKRAEEDARRLFDYWVHERQYVIADFKNETLRDRILKSWHTTGAGRTVSPKVLEASSCMLPHHCRVVHHHCRLSCSSTDTRKRLVTLLLY